MSISIFFVSISESRRRDCGFQVNWKFLSSLWRKTLRLFSSLLQNLMVASQSNVKCEKCLRSESLKSERKQQITGSGWKVKRVQRIWNMSQDHVPTMSEIYFHSQLIHASQPPPLYFINHREAFNKCIYVPKRGRIYPKPNFKNISEGGWLGTDPKICRFFLKASLKSVLSHCIIWLCLVAILSSNWLSFLH